MSDIPWAELEAIEAKLEQISFETNEERRKQLTVIEYYKLRGLDVDTDEEFRERRRTAVHRAVELFGIAHEGKEDTT